MKVRGLTYSILHDGKIGFEEGSTKIDKSIHFFFTFSASRRVYKPDFTPNLLWLLQKPSSHFTQFKTLLLGNLKKKLLKFVPFVRVESLQMIFHKREKQYSFNLDYFFLEQKDDIQQLVIFL